MHIHRNRRSEVVICDPNEAGTIVVELPPYFSEVSESVNTIAPNQEAQLKIHGVTPEFAHSLESLGYGNLSRSQLVSLKIYEIDAAFIHRANALGYGKLSVAELFYVKTSGVSVGKLAEMKKKRLSSAAPLADALVHVREINHKLELIRFFVQRGLRVHKGGDFAFADKMASLSVPTIFKKVLAGATAPNIKNNSAPSLANHMDRASEMPRRMILFDTPKMRSEHFRVNASNDCDGTLHATLFNMRIYGVTPEFIQEIRNAMRQQGISSKPSPEEWIWLKRYGVTAEFIRELASQSVVNLTVERLINLRIQNSQ